MNKSLVSALVLCVSVGLVGCDQKPSSNATGTPTSGSSTTGGAKSQLGKSVEITKDVANRATEAGKAVGEAAEQVGDTAAGAWADLRSKAASEGEKRLSALKAKVQELQTSNPALFTSLNEMTKIAEGKLAELKTAGAEAWKSLADQVKTSLDEIQSRVGK
jgi:gas vesicle protein